MAPYMQKDFQPLAKAAREQGWTLEQRTSGHWLWRDPDGKTVALTSGTPGTATNLKNTLPLLRKAGLVLPGDEMRSASNGTKSDKPYKPQADKMVSYEGRDYRINRARFHLIRYLHGRAGWREHHARMYPDDAERNTRSARGLHDLARAVEAGECADDELLLRIANLTDAAREPLGDFMPEEVNALTVRYRFNDLHIPDAEFLQELIALAEKLCGLAGRDEAADDGGVIGQQVLQEITQPCPQCEGTGIILAQASQNGQGGKAVARELADWDWTQSTRGRGRDPKYDYDTLLNGRCYLLIPGVDIADAKKARSSFSAAGRNRGLKVKTAINEDGALIIQAFPGD